MSYVLVCHMKTISHLLFVLHAGSLSSSICASSSHIKPHGNHLPSYFMVTLCQRPFCDQHLLGSMLFFVHSRLIPRSFAVTSPSIWKSLHSHVIFNFVNLMRSCHLVLMNKRKCDDDDVCNSLREAVLCS